MDAGEAGSRHGSAPDRSEALTPDPSPTSPAPLPGRGAPPHTLLFFPPSPSEGDGEVGEGGQGGEGHLLQSKPHLLGLAGQPAAVLLQLQPGGGAAQDSGEAVLSLPDGAGALGFEDGSRGRAAHPIGRGDEERRAVGAGGAGQPQPGGFQAAPATDRRHPQVYDDQREAGG